MLWSNKTDTSRRVRQKIIITRRCHIG